MRTKISWNVKALASAVPLVLVATSCSTPKILEDTTAACSNGVDDDQNGRVDCADDSCAATDACERSTRSCRDGLDNDGDGRIDCEQQSCRDLGACDPIQTDCQLVPQGGCPRGMACYPTSGLEPDSSLSCVTAGSALEGESCDPSLGDIAKGCAGGLVCVDGECHAMCQGDEQCSRASECLLNTNAVTGLCSQPCVPTIGCSHGHNCISLERMGLPYDRGGALLFCATASDLPPGTATVGNACEPRIVATTPLQRICEPTSLCVPDALGGDSCRRICSWFGPNSQLNQCGTERCVPIDPFDNRRATTDDLPGICLP